MNALVRILPVLLAVVVAVPSTTPGITPHWAYIKIALTALFSAMGYTVRL